jgi:hypothetical protein
MRPSAAFRRAAPPGSRVAAGGEAGPRGSARALDDEPERRRAGREGQYCDSHGFRILEEGEGGGLVSVHIDGEQQRREELNPQEAHLTVFSMWAHVNDNRTPSEHQWNAVGASCGGVEVQEGVEDVLGSLAPG